MGHGEARGYPNTLGQPPPLAEMGPSVSVPNVISTKLRYVTQPQVIKSSRSNRGVFHGGLRSGICPKLATGSGAFDDVVVKTRFAVERSS